MTNEKYLEEKKKPMTPFCKFVVKARKYNFYNSKGQTLDLWEVFTKKLKIDELLNNETKIKAVKLKNIDNVDYDNNN